MKRFSLLLLPNFFLQAPAVSFNFVFDNDTAPGLQPIVGTGTFANVSTAGLLLVALLGLLALKRSLRDYRPRRFSPKDCSHS